MPDIFLSILNDDLGNNYSILQRGYYYYIHRKESETQKE